MLLSVIRDWARLRDRRRLRKRVARTLALESRGGVLDDRLALTKLSNYLEVEWCARDVHPWNQDLPAERKGELFVAQALKDTLAAIQRLFDVLTEVDTIHLRVLEPTPPYQALLAGTVIRHDLNELNDARRFPSPAMGLKMLGIQYEVNDGSFERLMPP